MTDDWLTIGPEPRPGEPPWDDDEVLVFVRAATVPIVRLAWWCDGEMWKEHGMDSREEDRGWWSYDNSLTQVKLDGPLEPTHWKPAGSLPSEDLPWED